MIKKMLVWIAAVTVAALAGVPGVARATTVWVPASCATGSFDPVTVDGAGHYFLPAHVMLCEPYQARFNYTVVLFRTGGVLPMTTGADLQSYRAAGATTVTADVLPAQPTPLFGVCLMRSVTVRTACVRVDTAADGGVTSTPISVDDTLVAEQVLFFEKAPVNNPNYCATCLSLA
jgi:hypothetical protein